MAQPFPGKAADHRNIGIAIAVTEHSPHPRPRHCPEIRRFAEPAAAFRELLEAALEDPVQASQARGTVLLDESLRQQLLTADLEARGKNGAGDPRPMLPAMCWNTKVNVDVMTRTDDIDDDPTNGVGEWTERPQVGDGISQSSLGHDGLSVRSFDDLAPSPPGAVATLGIRTADRRRRLGGCFGLLELGYASLLRAAELAVEPFNQPNQREHVRSIELSRA